MGQGEETPGPPETHHHKGAGRGRSSPQRMWEQGEEGRRIWGWGGGGAGVGWGWGRERRIGRRGEGNKVGGREGRTERDGWMEGGRERR